MEERLENQEVYTYKVVQNTEPVFVADAAAFRRYSLIALIYALLHTFCLYRNTSGITYPFYMAGTMLLLCWVRHRDGLPFLKDRNGKYALNLFYIISLMLISVNKCMTANGIVLWLDGFAITLLMLSFLIHLYADTSGWDIFGWFMGIATVACRPFAHFFDPIYDFVGFLKNRGSAINDEKKKTIAAVLIGICLAVPMLFVVVSLLASADMIFMKALNNIADLISIPDNIWDYVGIVFLFIIALWGFYTIIKSLYKKGVNPEGNKNADFNPVAGITFTGILCAVYMFFSVIQIVYLFLGKMTLPDGYTYAKYAREGFFQLLTVSVMNLSLVLFCKKLFKENLVLKVILTLIGICTYIMIASSAFRMFMYIGVYHLTFFRVFVLWFLAVLALWLAYLLIGLYKETLPVFNLCMITVTVMYVAFIFANPDYRIAKYDLAFVESNTKMEEYGSSMFDFLVYEMSQDAVPAYEGNEKLLKAYATRLDEENGYYQRKYKEVRKFNFSRYKASLLLH